jgi:hypothetical protein
MDMIMEIILAVKIATIKILKEKKIMLWKIKIRIVWIGVNKNKAIMKTRRQMVGKIKIKVVGNN